MKTALKLAFGTGLATLALLASLAGNASAAAGSGIRLTEAGNSSFPQRTYVLSLPAGQRLDTSAVKVTENGHGVVGLKVVPSGTQGSVLSGTVLAIDASNSMEGAPIAGAISAARAFAARRNVNQRLAVLAFNNETKLALSLTASQSAIDSALSQEPPLHYKTRLYDAVAQAITLLRAAGIGNASVIVLSDGADVGSHVTLQNAIASAQETHVRIFTVGLRSKTFHPGALKQLASATSGSYSEASSPTELQQIYDQLGLQLAQEYVLTYGSIAKPGRHVTLNVSIQGLGSTGAEYVAPTIAAPHSVYHKGIGGDIWQSVFTMFAIGLLVPALVAAAVFVPLRRRRSTVRTRVSDYVSMPQRRELDELVSRVFTGTERSLERTQWWQKFKDALQFADVPIPPVQIAVGTFVVTIFVVWLLWQMAGPLGLLGLGVPLIVRAVIVARIARKRRLFADQLPDNLDVLASGLRAGHSLIGALAVVVADAAEPSKTEFQRVIADEQLGVPLEGALDRIVDRMKSRDMEQVALVASVQSETGGNSAEVLDRVTQTIRERQDLRRLTRTLTAQGRLARWIVSMLPIGILIAISVIAPDYIKPLFHHTSGLIMLTIGGLMIISGSVVIGKIVEIDV